MGNSLSVASTSEKRSMLTGKQSAPTSSAAPTEPAASADSVEEAPDKDASDASLVPPDTPVEAEKARAEDDAAVGAQSVTPSEPLRASEDAAAPEKCNTEEPRACSECKRVDGADKEDLVIVCAGCNLTVHRSCYRDELIPTEVDDGDLKTADATEASTWKCDCCRHEVYRQETKCEYCGKAGESSAMRVVDKSKGVAFWRRYKEFAVDVGASSSTMSFGHVLCINWDPRHLAAHMEQEKKRCVAETESKLTKAKPTTPPTAGNNTADTGDTEIVVAAGPKDETPALTEMLVDDTVPPTECCFCGSSAGVRIQCRRVSCARFFHAMCAHRGSGHVELRNVDFPQFHAYCDRHRDCTQDLDDFMGKLITRHMRSLVGRDEATRFQTLAKRISTYDCASSVLRYVASLFVSFCYRGLKSSKTDPPDFKMKQLQALQYFLNNTPQLEKVYGLPETSAQDWVDDKKVFRRLQNAFDPSKYVAKYPGPFSQQYTCDVCLDPFHERQHLFYCSGEDPDGAPHVQHWRCTKRRSSLRERERFLVNGASSKKKRKTLTVVQDGLRKDITIPKGLQSMTDDIICGVCRASVDARGLIASRKEAKRLDFEKKESQFVLSGCYINPLGSKACAGFAQSIRLPNSSANVATRRPSLKTADTKANGNVSLLQTTYQQELVPPKMDRINVQRTTRWLACVGQIIRLAGAPAAKTAVAAPTTKTPASDKTTPVSGPTAPATAPAIPAAVVPNTVTIASTPVPPVAPTANATPVNAVPVPTAPKATPNGTPATVLTKPILSSVATSAVAPAMTANGVSNGQLKSTTTSPSLVNGITRNGATPTAAVSKSNSLVTGAMQAYFNEALRLVRPYDPYALKKLETAHEMLVHRSGPGVAVLRMLTQEYTRFVYIKHTRAVEKVRNQKRKRAEHEAKELRERERKRVNREAEEALKSQMLAMRDKQRQHLKATSAKQMK